MPAKLSFESVSSQAKRRRVRKACVTCRKRKRKCDGKMPCGMCVTFEYHCEYTSDEGALAESPAVHSKDSKQIRSPIARLITEVDSDRCIVSEGDRYDPVKSLISHSAVTFPRTLALELQSTNPPRLHSFGWHCGIRPEEVSDKHGSLSAIVTKEEYYRYAKVYFAVVHPIFTFIDENRLTLEVRKCWENSESPSGYDAIIAGVVALGSFFSGHLSHPRELDIVHFAKNCIEDPAFSRVPSIKQIAAWLLRTIYLRTAAPPHAAWLASCTSLHLAEVVGLHHENDKLDLGANSDLSSEEKIRISEHARSIFWCAWSINTILSYDYGRSRVNLGKITCQPVAEASNSHLTQLVALAQLIPKEEEGSNPEGAAVELVWALESLSESQDAHPFLSLTKADLCLSFYRRLRLLNRVLTKTVVQQIIQIGDKALSAACTLVKESQSWWSVLSSSFQYVCVLLAIDTTESLSKVAPAMKKLSDIVQTLNTTVAREAFSTAKILLEESMKRKSNQIEQLKGTLYLHVQNHDADLLDINWDALLDPSSTLGF